MVEKPSKLLATAKELISNQKINEAVVICENVIKNDPNNINGLLLATKCWMDLDVKRNSVKEALEKVLILKPMNPNAIQGLRKFYEKNIAVYLQDGVKFYKQLFQINELNDKDYELITSIVVSNMNEQDTENFVCEYLESRVNKEKHVNSLMVLFQIAAEKVIINSNDRDRFDQFARLLALFDTNTNRSCDDDEIDYLRAMETFFRAFFDDMKPDYFYTLLDRNDSSVYGYLLFAKIVCKNYLFDDCQETIRIGLSKLESCSLLRPVPVQRAFQITDITNSIHSLDIERLQEVWPKTDAEQFVSKFLWCQSFAIGFDAFASYDLIWSNISDDWCLDMPKPQEILCRYLMEGDGIVESSRYDVDEDHQIIMNGELSSFQCYLWSRVMKKEKLLNKHQESVEKGLQCKSVYYQILAELAYISLSKKDYKMAVLRFLECLNANFCPTILEHLVDMHMSLHQYAEPVEIFDKLEIDQCTESLLRKFVLCLDKLDRLNDAIAIGQRLVKHYPISGQHQQLLGDLYLKRGNINSAYTMYIKSKELSEETSEMFARLGNVFSLNYQQSYNENDFSESVKLFDKSLELSPSIEAVEGKASVHFLHAEISLKQLMLSCSINDLNIVLNLLTNYDYLIKDEEFQMNLMGKVIFLSILGNIDKLIDFRSISLFLSMPMEVACDSYEIGFRCFKISMQKFKSLYEPYFNYALLCLLKLNRLCVNNDRDNAINQELYQQAEDNFKTSLYFNSKNSEAWKYLGYLYFRHGPTSKRCVFDIQHCLSTSINLSSSTDTLKDPEAAYLLGLLYIRENWCSLAKDLFLKIQMDHHANPIGYIGMYLLADQDHKVSEQMEITKAIMCYNYRDEDSNINESCHYQINDSIVGLFCDNLGFLVNSQCDFESFDSPEKRIDLISALKTSLNHAWTTFEAYNNLGLVFPVDKEKQYREYGCFYGMLELLTGNYQLGRNLIIKSKNTSDPNLEKLYDLLELDSTWQQYTNDKGCNNCFIAGCIANIKKVAKHIGLSVCENIQESSVINTRLLDEMILRAIVQHISSSSHLPNTLIGIINIIPQLVGQQQQSSPSGLTVGLQSSILSLSTIILLSRDSHSAGEFLAMLDKSLPSDIDSTIEQLPQILARLRVIVANPIDSRPYKEGWRYLLSHCIKQPYDMNRWLSLMEFGLEFIDYLDGFVTIYDIFNLTNRPWCLATLDIERYATILHRHSILLTPTTQAAINLHRHIVMISMKLFPHLVGNLLNTFFNI